MLLGQSSHEYKMEWQRAKRRRRRQEWIASQGGVCAVCGSTENLEIDHIDRSLKTRTIEWLWPPEKLAEELSNCQLLCRNCHRIKTNREVYDREPGDIHGRITTYDYHKCRCDECMEAMRERSRRAKARKRKAPDSA